MNNKETVNICPYYGECQLQVCKGDNNDYCYIRQLYDERYEAEHEVHRLNVENESLKQKSKYEFDETILQYSNLIEELKEENTQLKDEIERLKQPSLVVPPTPRMGISLDDDYAHRVLKQIKMLIKQGVKLHDDVIINRVELDVLIKRYESDNGIIL